MITSCGDSATNAAERPLNARAEVALDGRWLSVETEFDPALYRGLVATDRLDPVDVDWDGERSTGILDRWVVADLGVHDSPEGQIQRFQVALGPVGRVLLPIGSWLSNRTIARLRRAGADGTGPGRAG